MDPLTHVVLGGTAAQLLFHRRFGRKAFVMGAIAGALPDLDVFYRVDQWSAWVHHRGLTHSLFFPLVAGPLMGWLAWRFARWRRGVQPAGPDESLNRYILLWAVAIVSHPLLDTFTAYGTQLLAPMSDQRFAINAMAIIDPVYTLPLLIAGLFALIRPRRVELCIRAAAIALLLTTSFIGYAWYLNGKSERFAMAQLAGEGINDAKVTAYPTVFQAFLRRILVERPDEIRIGYLSAIRPAAIVWQRHAPPRHDLIRAVRQSDAGRILHWFSMGRDYYRIDRRDGLIHIEGHDLRYGVPGPSDRGFWGVRAVFDTNGQAIEPVQRFVDRPRVNLDGMFVIFDAAFGNQASQMFNGGDLRDAFRARD